MGWESFGVVGFDRGPVLQGRTRILHLQYFFKYVLTYSLHLNSYLVTFLHNTICREQLFCPFLLSGSEFLLKMLFNYHLLYFCTALSLIIMLSSHYYLHKSKTLSQLTQCLFRGTLLLFSYHVLKPQHAVLNRKGWCGVWVIFCFILFCFLRNPWGLNSYLLSPIVLAQVARETTMKKWGGGGNQLWFRVWEESLAHGPEAQSSDKSPF